MQANDVRVLKGAVVPTAVAGAAVILAATLLSGGTGALGAVIGLLVVVAFFTVGLVAVSYASRISPAMMMVAAIVTYAVKVLVIMALLKAFEDATAFEPRAFGWSAIICTVVWTAGEMRGFVKTKMLYVDPGAAVPGRGDTR
ncbi:ATP synthase protein I [Streptosporangium becharense]|uniref:ATP synthase protein I n=1 Tax=Streptosporangium becharense TaxID=1816182 RepID=A0A7W9MFJ1_9ACTN|nr:hypothetical protein [Streptosporangium becharense]MBB2909928.1 ATP synthase protein I [Streptosporangium becharense]MBB5819117.1 ATP synthase protein I [Streptosporangium becharense]